MVEDVGSAAGPDVVELRGAEDFGAGSGLDVLDPAKVLDPVAEGMIAAAKR
jgi:hypothetical protein